MATLKNSRNEFIFPVVSALIICLALFYIDEGLIGFKWMTSMRNWLIFLMYAFGLFLGLAMITTFVTKGSTGWLKKITIYLMGIPLGGLFIFIFMYLGSMVAAFAY